MAEIENEWGVRATYMVMTNSPLYHLGDKTVRDGLRRLPAMGHEVALHFDLDEAERQRLCEIPSVEGKIQSACQQLEDIIGMPVRSLSFHRPIPAFLRGPLRVCGRVNAYAEELMAWYLSDSKGGWREGEPLPKLLRPEKPLLQLLTHPIWWADEHRLPEDNLQALFESETQGQPPEYIKAWDAALANTLSTVRRRGFPSGVKEGTE